jgi:hypothetical protein
MKMHENVNSGVYSFLNGVHKHAFAGYEYMDVLKVEVYTFSKGNPGGHFTVTAGFCSIERVQKN